MIVSFNVGISVRSISIYLSIVTSEDLRRVSGKASAKGGYKQQLLYVQCILLWFAFGDISRLCRLFSLISRHCNVDFRISDTPSKHLLKILLSTVRARHVYDHLESLKLSDCRSNDFIGCHRNQNI